MKKIIALFAVVTFFAITTMAFAYGGGDVGNDTGDGEPPGWSQNSSGAGGSDGPAEGPNGP